AVYCGQAFRPRSHARPSNPCGRTSHLAAARAHLRCDTADLDAAILAPATVHQRGSIKLLVAYPWQAARKDTHPTMTFHAPQSLPSFALPDLDEFPFNSFWGPVRTFPLRPCNLFYSQP